MKKDKKVLPQKKMKNDIVQEKETTKEDVIFNLIIEEATWIPELNKSIPSGQYKCKTEKELEILRKYKIGGLE